MPEQLKTYFPCLTTRESECRALAALAEPTKDVLFPMVRLQAWPREKAGAGTPIERSITNLVEGYGQRPVGVDLGPPRSDLSTTWAVQGRDELTSLRNPANGFERWRALVSSHPTFIPTVQWSDNLMELRFEVEQLLALGRGLILRFRRTQAWNIAQLTGLLGIDFGAAPVLLIFDAEQIARNEDLTVLGMSAQSALLAARQLVPIDSSTFVLTASSFPSSFSDIHPTYAQLAIRERQLYEMLRQSPPLIQAGIQLRYGDHASVFAADREPSFRGAPRVDYPLHTRWVYHRSSISFSDAVQCLRSGPDWNDQLLCWGAQRIRTASEGDMTGLGSQTPWVAIRLNIHMHLQAHFAQGGTDPIDEPWID
jgi:hypothetical protein